MRKEAVLFYIINNKIYIYLLKAKKEIMKRVDTSFFFHFGEISNVEKFYEVLEKLLRDEKILTGLFKPNLYVLYNDVTYCDLKYLYKASLIPFNYERIEFITLSSIIKMINNEKNVVFFDENYYTVFKDNYKTINQRDITFNPIYIGKKNITEAHYADDLIVWKTFISRFTKK